MKTRTALLIFSLLLTQAVFSQILPANMYADTSHAPFWYGVASGDPLQDRVILWTHLEPDSFAAPAETLTWEISEVPAFSVLSGSGTVITDSSRDWTVKVDAGGLSSGTAYYYRFEDSQGNYSATGRTKTAVTGNQMEVKVVTTSCSSLWSGFFNAYRRIGERDLLDAVIHSGDFIYNSIDPDEEVRVPIPKPDEPETLHEWRDRHQLYRLDPDLRYALQQQPFIILWDNHDIATDPDLIPMQAFYEWTPTRMPDSLKPRRLYRKFSFGNLVDLFMIDMSIMWRDQDTLSNGDLSTLGSEQKQWLFNELGNSTAKWKLIGQQRQITRWGTSTFQAIYPTQGGVFSEKTWDGYPTERTEVLDFLENNGIDNVIFLTGDSHTSLAADVTRAPNSNNYDVNTGSGSLAVEFLPTSISRGNFDEAGIPSFLIFAIEAASKLENPWQIYLELVSHGYGSLDLNADTAKARFWYSEILNQSNSETMAKEMLVLDGDNHWHRPGAQEINSGLNISVKLFPNPNRGRFSVEMKGFPMLPVYFQVINLEGKLVFWTESAAGQSKVDLALPELAKGSYLLRIKCGNSSKIEKLLLK